MFKNLSTGAKARFLSICAATPVVALATSATAFAADSSGGGSGLPSIAITEDMLRPLVDGVIANVSVILPIGLGLFAVFLGIRIIPALISRFVHM